MKKIITKTITETVEVPCTWDIIKSYLGPLEWTDNFNDIIEWLTGNEVFSREELIPFKDQILEYEKDKRYNCVNDEIEYYLENAFYDIDNSYLDITYSEIKNWIDNNLYKYFN